MPENHRAYAKTLKLVEGKQLIKILYVGFLLICHPSLRENGAITVTGQLLDILS